MRVNVKCVNEGNEYQISGVDFTKLVTSAKNGALQYGDISFAASMVDYIGAAGMKTNNKELLFKLFMYFGVEASTDKLYSTVQDLMLGTLNIERVNIALAELTV